MALLYARTQIRYIAREVHAFRMFGDTSDLVFPEIRAGNSRVLAEGFLVSALVFLGMVNAAAKREKTKKKKKRESLNARADLMSKRSPRSYESYLVVKKKGTLRACRFKLGLLMIISLNILDRNVRLMQGNCVDRPHVCFQLVVLKR